MTDGSRQVAREEQRERALTAASRLFEEQGLEGVSLRAIASEIDLTAMALYRYFPGGKGEVVATLRGKGFERLAWEFAGAVRGIDDPIEQFVALTVALVRFAVRGPGLYRLMFEVTQPEEHEAYLRSRRALAWELPQRAFVEAIGSGALRGDPEVLPHLVFAAVHGVIAFELSGQPHPNRRLSSTVAPLLELLFRGAGGTPATLRKLKKLADPKLWTGS